MNAAGLPQLPPAGIYDTFLETTYKDLVGQSFLATYERSPLMPQTQNRRDILVVGVESPFNETLKAVMRSVVDQCGETVWKGITLSRPIDRSQSIGSDVCLWVESTFFDEIYVGSTHWFKIEETTVFQCFPGTGFPDGGVNIKASLLRPH